MESLTHSLNHELPQDIHFDKYAQQILENSRTPNLADTTTIALASSPSITSFDSAGSSTYHQTTSEFLKKLGATFIHSIQLQSLPRTNTLDNTPLPGIAHSSLAASTSINDMDMEFGPHHLLMDSNNYNNAMDELQKQLDYDKFMNEVWIGVVLTLVLISMIFCFCSCFLYHQFRVWKRNYRTTVTQSNDVEAIKLNLDIEDPVPEYTLVSGLPSYEAALELLNKNHQSCLIVHPSVFEVFNKNEIFGNESSSIAEANAPATEVSMPLLNEATNHNVNKSTLHSCNEASSTITVNNSVLPYNHSLASLLSLATQITSQCKPKSTASTPSVSEEEKQFKA